MKCEHGFLKALDNILEGVCEESFRPRSKKRNEKILVQSAGYLLCSVLTDLRHIDYSGDLNIREAWMNGVLCTIKRDSMCNTSSCDDMFGGWSRGACEMWLKDFPATPTTPDSGL